MSTFGRSPFSSDEFALFQMSGTNLTDAYFGPKESFPAAGAISSKVVGISEKLLLLALFLKSSGKNLYKADVT